MRHIVVLALAGLLVSGLLGQSPDRDHPTRMTSPEVTGFIGAREKDADVYYSLAAGPGEVTITISVQASPGVSFPTAGATVEVFGPDSTRLGKSFLQSDGSQERNSIHFVLRKEQPLLLRISPYDNGGSGGKYSVRVDGAVVPKPMANDGQPSSQLGRTLRLTMRDGSVKDIDLSQVREISIKP